MTEQAQAEPKLDQPYSEASLYALGRSHAAYWKGLRDGGLSRGEALRALVAYVAAAFVYLSGRPKEE